MGRQVAIREAAEDIRDLDHGRCPASQAGHQLVDDPLERAAGRFGQVRVGGGRCDADVPEQNLHDSGVDAAFQEPRGIAMPQRMRREALRDAGFAGRCPKRAPQCVAADWPVVAPVGAQPSRVAMHLPQAAQLVEDRLRQWHSTFLVALANDADHPIDAIDCGHFKGRSLADA
jgi:hypothetical protein